MEQLTERLRLLQVWSGMSYRAVHRELVRDRAARRVPERPVLNTVYRCFRPGRARLDIDLVVDIARLLLAVGGVPEEAADEVAEQWRQTCWLVAGLASAAAIVSVADTWPADLPSFTGRHADLRRILELEGTKGWAIAGMPGVGKTRLAIRAGHLLTAAGRFTDVRLAVDLRGYDPDQPPADPNAVLEGFLRRLGVGSGQIQHVGQAERTAKYRQLLSGSNALVLLDNAASAEQVRPLLPAGPGSLVLITSRRRLPDLPSIRPLVLDVLTSDEAVGMLREAIGAVDAEPGIAAEVAELLGHLPLALAVVASRIRADPEWTLADHLERLRHHRHSLRLDSGVEVAISLSYRDLPADQQRAFRLLALHPGAGVTPHAAAALTGTDLDEAHRLLDQLTAASLMQCPTSGRYRFHDLIRTYAGGRAHDEDPAAVRRACLARLGEHYLHTAARATDLVYPHDRHRRPRVPEPATPAVELPDPAAARAWLDAERINLLAVATHLAQDDTAFAGFAAILHNHLAVTGRYADGRLLHEQVIEAARRNGDVAAEVGALVNLGELDVRTGRYEQVIDGMQRVLDLGDGPAGRDGVARALRYLGLASQLTGRYERAADYYQQALALSREAGDRIGEASGLGNLGVIYQLAGRYELAAEHHWQAMVVFEAIGAVENKARALDHLGVIEQLTGHHERAAEHHREALALFVDTGSLEGQATALDHLGVIEQLTGHYEQAGEHHRQALALSRQIGDPDDEARALNNLGDLARRTGRYGESVGHYERSLSLYRDLGDPAGQATAVNGIGEVALATGDHARALAAHAEAHMYASKIGQQPEQARACAGLGEVHHHLGEAAEAREQWQQALALYEELGVPEAGEMRARLTAR
ncbi:tetratricopeptide repeat protein [Actinophytocola sp.]|uniref:ATP-binding protein n=1 Tax=Actinophytocola sp. TaxID=1872138 RepID=UPI0025C23566|nr:tetratricopeptide repeat protein [Actinophytocola sp.]